MTTTQHNNYGALSATEPTSAEALQVTYYTLNGVEVQTWKECDYAKLLTETDEQYKAAQEFIAQHRAEIISKGYGYTFDKEGCTYISVDRRREYAESQTYRRLAKKTDIESYDIGDTGAVFIKIKRNYWTDVLSISVIYPLTILKKSAGTRNAARELGDEVDAIEAILRDKLPAMLCTNAESLGEIPQVLADSVYFNNEAIIKITL